MGKFAEVDEIDQSAPPKWGCAIWKLQNCRPDLDAKDLAVINKWLTDLTYSNGEVMRKFQDAGEPQVTTRVIQAHRAGNCCRGAGRVR